MCGIAGLLNVDGAPVDPATLDRMTDRVAHRGPDGRGTWIDGPVGLGHRRLAILDTGETGAQPMVSEDGRFVLSYNGEIYGFEALRRRHLDPAGLALRSCGDTAVLLGLIQILGLERTLPLLNGMFAFALWDRRERTLHLARDRVGIKPLYWLRRPGVVLFASQVRALWAHPAWVGELSREGLLDYFGRTYLGGGKGIFDGCAQVAPGEWVRIDAGGRSRATRFSPPTPDRRPFRAASPAAGADTLEALLEEVLGEQIRADVPVGAFLSGGIDSGTLVALLSRERAVKTFSIGYREAEYDEGPAARAVAEHLGTEHTEIVLTAEAAADLVPTLGSLYDEPFADASQLPTHVVSRCAREQVRVVLSGDGGDELFAGYGRYVANAATWAYRERVPSPLRGALAGLIDVVPAPVWRTVLRPLLADAGRSLPALARLLRYRDILEYHRDANPLGAGEVLDDGLRGASAFQIDPHPERSPAHLTPLDHLLLHDQRVRLPGGMLTKVDRASMGCGLEVRVPLLDNRVVDYSWTLPPAALVRDGVQKAALRDVLARRVPPSLFAGPKRGFHVPLALWLRGRLRDWAEALLADALPDASDVLDGGRVTELWSAFLGERPGTFNPVWTVLMFLAWRSAYRSDLEAMRGARAVAA